ncbi:MAG: hypothetical protein IJE08_05195 [Clostridia bacterium]|nr:hypothetical protein [Clostridia bacterium]
MEGLIVIIGIIISIVNVINKSKKVRNNAPGRASAPQRPATSGTAVPAKRAEPPRPAAPVVKPTVSAPAETQPTAFWEGIGDILKDELGAERLQKGHEAPGRMSEGDSRECEHGSIGGSMAYGGHQEGREKRTQQPAKNAYDRQNEHPSALYRPAMNAQEMRRAVVMAEILKRPQERMNEQARRWAAR